MAALATACGGGGGGDGGNGGNPPPDPTGQIAAEVVDEFETPIPSATVTVTAGSESFTGTTGTNGTVTISQVPTGSVSVSAAASGFTSSAAQGATVNEDTPTPVTLVLQRVAEATGGVVTALPTAITQDGTSFSFSLRLVVIDQDFEPVPGLTETAFSLENCTPQTETEGTQIPNCVRGSSLSNDQPYTALVAAPSNFAPVPAGTAVPYAAALLLDSSGSIGGAQGSDPTDARIFASKVFLGGVDVGGGDLVMLSAFADDNPTGSESRLPDVPLTIYPCDPDCATDTPQFTDDGESLFPSLDSLATLEDGGTPLYDTLSTMLTKVDQAAPTTPANLRRAVVLFSDGDDIYCGEGSGGFQNCISQRQAVVDLSDQVNVDIFTIGLSNGVNSLAMAELALRGNVGSGAYMFAENTTQLIPIYGTLGRLLSNSLPTYEMEWTVQAAQNVLLPGRALIGRVTVNTGTTTFSLPFVVQIFQPI